MKIESVDFFYLSMPEILDVGDGSQDALLVRVRAGGYEGWGECEASPLVSIASYVCPMSHSACKPVCASVLGQPINDIRDIERLGRRVRENSLDLLQADHTLSGIDIALWDLMGKKLEEPVYRLLGDKAALPKRPYASQLFGSTPEKTRIKAQRARREGFSAVKFGWGPYGRATADQDALHVEAARSGIGESGTLLVDAGTVWGEDVEAARERLDALNRCGVEWLEEPFHSGALGQYSLLSQACGPLKLAGGEGCHNFSQAQTMIDCAGILYIQIDTGRVGGITDARKVAEYAHRKGVTYVNHTFTTHLALSASLQPYAGMEGSELCEYPLEPSQLAVEMTKDKLEIGSDGLVRLPEKPGLGIEPDLAALRKYLIDTQIRVGGKVLYRSPEI